MRIMQFILKFAKHNMNIVQSSSVSALTKNQYIKKNPKKNTKNPTFVRLFARVYE